MRGVETREAERREEDWGHVGRRPLGVELHVQQHDDVSTINAPNAKLKEDLIAHYRNQVPLPHPAC